VKHTINLEPAQEILDGRQLNKLIHLWLEKQRLRSDVSSHTVGCYANKVAYFVEWWEHVGPWCGWELTKDRLGQFGDWLLTVMSQYGTSLEYNTRKDILKRLRQCFRWAKRKDYLSCDITSWVPDAVGEAPLRERATLDELAALMAAAATSQCAVRDQALIAIYIGTGVRRTEAVGIDVADIRMNADLSGTAKVRRAKRVKGRQVRGRIVAFDRWTGHYLAALLDTYSDPSGPLFRSRLGQRLGDASAYQAVKRAISRAGLANRIEGPHDLRRNFATWFSKTHRGELHGRLLSRQLGHSGFAMTDHYILHDADDLVEVIRSPLADY
jgi:site-specific recombinase XerD